MFQETITFDFESESARDVAVTALATSFGWQPLVHDAETDEQVANPVGQAAYVKLKVGALLFDRIKLQLRKNALEATEAQCSAVFGSTVVS